MGCDDFHDTIGDDGIRQRIKFQQNNTPDRHALTNDHLAEISIFRDDDTLFGDDHGKHILI